MGRPLYSQAYSSPAVRVEPEQPQPQPYERWSYWRQFDPDSEDFFADAQEERICTPEPEAMLDGVVRGASPELAEDVDSSNSSEASSSGRATPTHEEDALSVEELELEFRRRVAARDARETAARSPVASDDDDGQTYRAVARPNTSYMRTSYYVEGPSRSPSPVPARMPIPRAQVAPEPLAASSSPIARSNPIPIPIPARPTTPQNYAPSYSYGSPSPPPSVTPRLYTWARSTLPTIASPGSPLPNRGARRSFANISASPSTARVVF